MASCSGQIMLHSEQLKIEFINKIHESNSFTLTISIQDPLIKTFSNKVLPNPLTSLLISPEAAPSNCSEGWS